VYPLRRRGLTLEAARMGPNVRRPSVTDNRMKDGVTVMINGRSSPDMSVLEPPLVALESPLPNQAVQVLAMAQRTADEHVQTAQRRADNIRADALAAAEQIVHDADVHAENLRREADKVLGDARATAEHAARESQARIDEAQREAERIVAKARTQAVAVAAKAEEYSEELKQQAQRRYDDLVGTLAARRESLQSQIEALERFDHEYRARLTAFMQGQLRALWVDQPQVNGEPEAPEALMPRSVEVPNTSTPVQRPSLRLASESTPGASSSDN
jgi:cell division septum initiation protein DivIVA